MCTRTSLLLYVMINYSRIPTGINCLVWQNHPSQEVDLIASHQQIKLSLDFLLKFSLPEAKLSSFLVQVNLCQKLLFLHQLTHNMTTDCSLNYKFNTWKFQAQTWGEHVVYRNCFWHSEQFLYTTCSPHVLQKEELLTKIYLYRVI